MPPGEREGTGQHYYSEETLERLRKIDQLKKLGVKTKQKVLTILRQHLTETDQKMSELQLFRNELQSQAWMLS